MKRFFLTLLISLLALSTFGQSNKITEYSTTHIWGRDIEGTYKMATKFEVYKDSVVITIIEPSVQQNFKENNISLSETLKCKVKLVEENAHGRVYSYYDEGGEIILKVYSQPSTLLRVVHEDGTINETNFIILDN